MKRFIAHRLKLANELQAAQIEVAKALEKVRIFN